MAQRVISADITSPAVATPHAGLRCVGAGRAHEVLRADFQDHLALAVSACGFEYIRFHGLFNDDMGVYMNDASGTPRLSFTYIDSCFDALLETGIRPFVEFGFSPPPMARGTKTVFWWRGNVTMPSDLRTWDELIEATMTHWIKRYGRQEVNQWYFECWNEPDLASFWDGTMEEYFALYETTARAVKRVEAECRVGGPATARHDWISDFIEHCHAGEIPLDFVSCHTYATTEGDGLDEFGRKRLFMSDSDDSIVEVVNKARADIEASAMPELELHFTEWNSSYSPRDPVHDSYYNAAFIVDKLARIGDDVDSMSYWAVSDIFEEPGPVQTPFHGGFGLLNAQGLRKPSFYVHQFLNRLLPETVPCSDERARVTIAEDRAAVLVWDHRRLSQDRCNQEFFVQDLPAKTLPDIKIRLAGLAAGAYTMEATRVGYRSNDVYAGYCDLGRPDGLTREEVIALDLTSNGAPLLHERVIVGGEGVWERDLPMRANDVWFVQLLRA